MRAWMNGCSYKETVGFGNVTLMTRVTGFEELLSDMSDRDSRSSFVIESAWPTWASLCSLPVSRHLPKPFDQLRKPVGLSWVEIP